MRDRLLGDAFSLDDGDTVTIEIEPEPGDDEVMRQIIGH